MVIRDQIGQRLEFSATPKRIISLVPSQTELLIHLGLKDHLVGVTKFCVHPTHIRKEKTVVGGTKQIHYDKVDQLNPDIILCNKEENTKEIVETLQKKYTVHVSDIFTIEDALQMISQYGYIFGKENEAIQLTSRIENEMQAFQKFIKDRSSKKVAYMIWRKPWMTVGKHTFIDHLLKLNGFINIFENRSRYPEIEEKDIAKLDADLVLLSSEPFPFTEKHIAELRDITSGRSEIKLVDGEYFSWYGSRLVDAFAYFRTLH